MTKKAADTKQQDILIVDDNNLLNQVMCLQVKGFGAPLVRSAKGGRQALKMIKERMPSLLILDVGLPDITGRELIAELRRNPLTSSLPLIVHSTTDLSEEERTQLKLGTTRFITKATAFSERLAELINEVTK